MRAETPEDGAAAHGDEPAVPPLEPQVDDSFVVVLDALDVNLEEDLVDRFE